MSRYGCYMIALMAVSFATSASGQEGLKPPEYQKVGFFERGIFSSGYRDKLLNKNSWRVIGKIGTGIYAPSAIENIAFYRAADLAEANGMKYIKLIKRKYKSTHQGFFYGPQIASEFELDFEVTNIPDAEAHCASDILETKCKTYDVAALKIKIGPSLVFPSDK